MPKDALTWMNPLPLSGADAWNSPNPRKKRTVYTTRTSDSAYRQSSRGFSIQIFSIKVLSTRAELLAIYRPSVAPSFSTTSISSTCDSRGPRGLTVDIVMDESTGPSRRSAKIGHRKSRKGCKCCKRRRVKCDETHPVCGNCSRLTLDCAWPDVASRPTPSPDPVSLSSRSTDSGEITKSQDSPASNKLERFFALLRPQNDQQLYPLLDDNEDIELPESKERRLLEHRLMQNYLQAVVQPFPMSPNREWRRLFSHVMTKLALTHDNLLYALLTVSASHLLLTEPDDMELFSARQSYLILAMREQRKMVERLSVDTADAVCFTSLLLLINSFSMLRDRSLEEYHPPLEWIHIGRGAGTVIWLSVEAAHKSGDFESSSMYVIAKSYPRFGEDQSYFSPVMREGFEGILTQALPSGEVWDDATKEAYEKTLSYVGSVHNAIRVGEPVYAICRRIQAFPLLMPAKFITFLEEQRPRALTVLAHFFAVVVQVHGVWWLREGEDGESTAKREVRAISKVLPPEWKALLVWPLEMVGLR
ncbi:hypothetical protein CONLIGDRAFT_679467 [Coniochaeta ligniaria NRRL 30616]|uniref:Zn(2)-C6 fungal-type domain-containing protein n=1 Tax=Coniochaeta ligniaria NRRL 30616 TaxID=1408157 RepID=A0A1J7ITQ9_9PEZI|nr:hypothetical protein CONLIGDRAFT_679467 [Coniochaeta ligniaria NRRL 30616]